MNGWGDLGLQEVDRVAKQISAKSNTSAGILTYRRGALGLEVLLVHPGGPFLAQQGRWRLVDPKRRAGPVGWPQKSG